jgi:hypothetical protein
MITEDYVSLETAKLLKEKGFNELTPLSYSLPYGHESHIPCSNDVDTDFVSRITLQMAMKWLREVHNLHIAVIVAYHHLPRRYEAHIMKLENIDDFILRQQVDFDTYEEACEEAIKYCLENLI